MNKKILCVIALLLVAVCALCACKDDKTVLELYKDVTQATKVEQKIVVKDGAAEVATETLTYDMSTMKVAITRKTLNPDVTTGEATVTTTDNRTFAKGEAVAAFEGLTLTAVVETDSSFKGTVAHADVDKAFGSGLAAKVNGDVTVEMKAANGRVTQMTLTYKTANNFDVTLTATYTY